MRIGEEVQYTIDLKFSTSSVCAADIKDQNGSLIAAGMAVTVPDAIYAAATQLAGRGKPMKTISDNIVLDYHLQVIDGEHVYNCPRGAEFFEDEHGHQWVKFAPNNGYNAGKEHMRRTEDLLIVKMPEPTLN